MTVEETRRRWRARYAAVRAALRSHPALVLTGSYLFLTAVGLLYSSLFFRFFGIRFSDYAQPEDLLMAALKEPLLIALILVSLVLVYMLVRLDFWLRERYEWYDRMQGFGWIGRLNDHPSSLVAMGVLYAFLFTLVYAAEASEDIKDGAHRRVVVELRTGDAPRRLERTLLETTSGFVLVYDDATEEARAIPYESIVSLIISPAEEPSGEPAAASASEPRRRTP